MNIEDIRKYCLALPGTSEDMPFDEDTLVFKVKGKMFLLTNLEGDLSINIKCDPERIPELREKYTAVLPGYHMNKKHWNTVMIDGSIRDGLIYKWIDDSYDLIVEKLPRKIRNEFEKP